MLAQKSLIESSLQYALERGAEFAEVFIEKNFSQKIQILNSKPESISNNMDFGLGLRLFIGEEIFYATTNIIEEENIRSLICFFLFVFNVVFINSYTIYAVIAECKST